MLQVGFAIAAPPELCQVARRLGTEVVWEFLQPLLLT